MHSLIIGASRGIGLEWARQALAAGERVTATARDEVGLERLRSLGATPIALDVTDAASVAGWTAAVGGALFDRVLFVAGVYGPRHSGLEPPIEAEFDAVMHANVLGAMRVLPQLDGRLAPQAVVAVLSSRMGSIGERSNSAGWLYRASKAALNSVLKDAALKWSGKAICVALHPGWVRTDMGGAGADLGVVDSVAILRNTLSQLGLADNGRFLNLDGRAIAW